MRIGEGVESAGKKERYLAVGCLLLLCLLGVAMLCLVGVYVGIGVWEEFNPPRFRKSRNPSISADGRYVAFQSNDESNLVSGDTNGERDIFVLDRQTGETTRVSVASDGTQANRGGGAPWNFAAISADGRYVAFDSNASNLVSGDTDGERDIFVHDRQTGETRRVSVASDGWPGDESSYSPSISADGRYVAFTSWASTLVRGDTNPNSDIFVHDRQTGQTTHVSVASDGTQANVYTSEPSISADGRYVAFGSFTHTKSPMGTPMGPSDIFVHDRQTGETERVSIPSQGP